MPRGRKRKPAPPLPPKGFYQADVRVAVMVREGVLSLSEGWMLNLLAMFDWQGTGKADVTVSELARWLGVRREHAQRMFARLRALGLVERGEDGRICVTYKSRDIATSLPTPLYGGGGNVSSDVGDISFSGKDNATRAREKTPPPPYLSNTVNLRDADITQIENHVISESHKIATAGAEIGVQPPIAAVCAHMGVETEAGVRALARLGVGPRALLTWHRERTGRGSHVGSMVKLAARSPKQARRRIEAARGDRRLWIWQGRDFCPRCGASWETLYRPLKECPECGAQLRECRQCGELAVVGRACSYCGAEEVQREGHRQNSAESSSFDQPMEENTSAGGEVTVSQTPRDVIQEVLHLEAERLTGPQRGFFEEAVRRVDVLEFDDGYVVVVPSQTVRFFLQQNRELRERLSRFKEGDILVEIVVQGSVAHRAFVAALEENG